MAINLSRNTKVYFTTQTADTGYDATNTFEIKVLDGYSFSQSTEQQTIQLNEAGATPNRGQRSFNTQLNPVDWSLSTYVRPVKFTSTTAVTATTVTATNGYATATVASHTLVDGDAITAAGFTSTAFNAVNVPVEVIDSTHFKWPVISTLAATASVIGTINKVARVTCPESHLWNALMGPYNRYNVGTTPAWTETSGSAVATTAQSEDNALAPFSLIFVVDQAYYKVKGCAVNQAEVQFGLDQITQINWTGFGTSITDFSSNSTFKSEINGIPRTYFDTANFITNKLSVLELQADFTTAGAGSGTVYNIPITGGNVTYSNNVSYLTPSQLGVVNTSIGYYTGARSITGNVTAYLRTGSADDSGTLLNSILTGSATSTETKYWLKFHVGGSSSAATRVDIMLPSCQLQVPTVDIQDVVSTSINFTAQGYSTSVANSYDIENPNEMTLTYFSA